VCGNGGAGLEGLDYERDRGFPCAAAVVLKTLIAMGEVGIGMYISKKPDGA